MNHTYKGQISESRRLAVLLAISGGLMDAYTYIFRGGVFANAQTGNILLFGVRLSEGNFLEAMRYFFPVVSFALGIVLAEAARHFCVEDGIFHWRQLSVLLECVILFAVGFIPTAYNLPANALVSFACGIQVESFRKVKGNASATTMCIGNLRSGTQAIFDFTCTKEKKFLHKGLIYYGIIASFVIGAILGNILIRYFSQRAVWCSSILLLICFLLMFIRSEEVPSDQL